MDPCSIKSYVFHVHRSGRFLVRKSDRSGWFWARVHQIEYPCPFQRSGCTNGNTEGLPFLPCRPYRRCHLRILTTWPQSCTFCSTTACTFCPDNPHTDGICCIRPRRLEGNLPFWMRPYTWNSDAFEELMG